MSGALKDFDCGEDHLVPVEGRGVAANPCVVIAIAGIEHARAGAAAIGIDEIGEKHALHVLVLAGNRLEL